MIQTVLLALDAPSFIFLGDHHLIGCTVLRRWMKAGDVTSNGCIGKQRYVTEQINECWRKEEGEIEG